MVRKNIKYLLFCFLLILIFLTLAISGGFIDINKVVMSVSSSDGAKKCVPAQWLDPANGDNGFFGFYCSYSLCTSFNVIKTVKVSCSETEDIMKKNNKQYSEEEYPYWGISRWLPNIE